MRFTAIGVLVLWTVWTLSCSAPSPEQRAPVVPTLEPAPVEKSTGIPGIDQAQELEVQILDARGTGSLGGVPIAAGRVTALSLDRWMLTDAGSEYEITLRGPLLTDGIIRLDGHSAFLVEDPQRSPVPRFRLFGGHASFYLPHLPDTGLTVLTPAGPLQTRGAVFTVTVAPDFQVLVTCREGSVYLGGSQNAVVEPGQVVVADRLGRGRVYSMTPNEALVFAERWLKVMAEEAATGVSALLPLRLSAWQAQAFRRPSEEARFLALWFRQAKLVLGTRVPGPEIWMASLTGEVRTSWWEPPLAAPGLLGESP